MTEVATPFKYRAAYKEATASRAACPRCGRLMTLRTLAFNHDCTTKKPRKPRSPNRPLTAERTAARVDRAKARLLAKAMARLAPDGPVDAPFEETSGSSSSATD
jgi:hypothetical protein